MSSLASDGGLDLTMLNCIGNLTRKLSFCCNRGGGDNICFQFIGVLYWVGWMCI